jgi:hypothetical protein
VPLDPHSPEMLRDVSALEPDYGADSVSLAPEGRDYSIADGDYTSIRSEVRYRYHTGDGTVPVCTVTVSEHLYPVPPCLKS